MVDAVDRKWLLKDITNLIAQEDVHILDIGTDTSATGGRVRLRLRVRVRDYGQLGLLLGRIEALAGVESAQRG